MIIDLWKRKFVYLTAFRTQASGPEVNDDSFACFLFMLKNFRAYILAVEFYRMCSRIKGPRHLTDQLNRASSSVPLNLAEGSEGASLPNRRRFYRIAMGSLRESQAILDLLSDSETTRQARKLGDELGACVFKLCKTLDHKLNSTNPSGPEARGLSPWSPESLNTDQKPCFLINTCPTTHSFLLHTQRAQFTKSLKHIASWVVLRLIQMVEKMHKPRLAFPTSAYLKRTPS